MKDRRYLALHLPFWAAEHLRQSRPDLPADQPLALWARQGARRLLVALDHHAAAAGLEPGQALADAEAMLPDLLVLPAMPEASAAGLRDLALWAQRFTPISAALPPDGLLLDITGCDHLFGGEAALLSHLTASLAEAGLSAQGAIASAAASAMALARVRRDAPIIEAGSEEKAVAPLPLGPALRLPDAMVEGLARLGLRLIGDVLRQPRAPLARRFGAPLLDALDAATGRRAPPITPIAAPPDLAVTRALPEPILTAEAIAALLDRLLAALCARLGRAGLGARRLGLAAWRVDGTEQRLMIGTGAPNRDPAHLARLFAEPLTSLAPELGFERFTLHALATDPMGAEGQGALPMGAAPRPDGVLAQLLDRLGQRLRLARPAPLPSHWPERQWRAAAPHEAPPATPPGWGARAAPVLLRRRPEAVQVTAFAEGAPAALRWRGRHYALTRAEGPLRLEAEWWHGGALPPARDYHRVQLASGERLWLCHADGRWVVQGDLP
ncbi:MAG: Y-family DNA polymerase [Acetobacteraceae bacterium]|jgi:protein ImuB